MQELLNATRNARGLGLVAVSMRGATFIGRMATEEDAARIARKLGQTFKAGEDPRFVLHRHNGLSGWSEGTEVTARFDRHGRRTES